MNKIKKITISLILTVLFFSMPLFAEAYYNNYWYNEYSGPSSYSNYQEISVTYDKNYGIFPFALLYGNDNTNYINQDVIINNIDLIGNQTGRTDTFHLALQTFFFDSIEIKLKANSNFISENYDSGISLRFFGRSYLDERPYSSATNELTFYINSIFLDSINRTIIRTLDRNSRLRPFYNIADFWIEWDQKEYLPSGNYSATVNYSITSLE